MSSIDLNTRQREVLATVVLNYVLTGVPVGSRTVSRGRADGLSPATIRNTMAELEEMGCLQQPHTSAGRIPSDSGYRCYVDSLMSEQPLSPGDLCAIRNALPLQGEAPGVGDLLHRTVRLLADLSSQVGVVLAPRFPHAILRRLDFLGLPDGRVLGVFVSQSGMVDHKVIEAPEPLTDADLSRISNLVNENFSGMTLPGIRSLLIQEMSKEKALYDRLLSRALQLCRSYLDRRAGDGDEILLDGTSNVFGERESADLPHMRELFRAFENKGRLVQLLNACLDEGRTQIRIGSECDDPTFRDMTVITSPYCYRDQPVGALGIIGPRRMPYGRLVTLVDSLSKFLSEALAVRAQGGRSAGPGGDSHDR